MSSLPTTPQTVEENPLYLDIRYRLIAIAANAAPEWERRKAANNVLNFFRSAEGYPSGTFTQKLLSCMGSADGNNVAILANAYPVWGECFILGQQFSEGLDILRGRAAK